MVLVLSERLSRRVRRDFPAPGSADEILRLLAELPTDKVLGSERVQAAIVLLADGDFYRLRDGLALARIDWRDVLVAADLADSDWLARLDRELDPA